MFVAGVKFQREPSFPSYARLESGPSFHQQYNRGFPKHLFDDRSISYVAIVGQHSRSFMFSVAP